MDNTSSSDTIISNLNSIVETLIEELEQIKSSSINLHDADELERLEIDLHEKTTKIADLISAIKLQKALDSTQLEMDEKNLIKSSPKKMKNMGRRTITIRVLGGTPVTIITTYYHQKTDLKKLKGRKGFYPRLLLLGIHDRCTPALSSRASLFSTAACSLEEAQRLMNTLYGFSLGIKTIRMICRRFAMRARIAFKTGEIPLTAEFQGRHVVISMDGGRLRIRKNKKEPKTKKNRSHYKTDWREPKLIIVYVVDRDEQKDRKVSPIMDASLDGPDAIFCMLLYYLKKLGVAAADKLLFISDGAKWIWERVTSLITGLGIQAKQLLMALDFYHAVEHLTSIAAHKKWKKKKSNKWVNKQRKRLLKGKLDVFMEEIEFVCKGEKNKILRRECKFFKSHLPHMRYEEIKNGGLPIGSGAVESGS